MFTGIIEEMGTIGTIHLGEISGSLEIMADVVLKGTRIGDSIAVNGVCLTVTGIHGRMFQADVMAETLRRSNLGLLEHGDTVNLERAMPCDGRFGGHIVSGHIDGMGVIRSRRVEGNAVWVQIEAPSEIMALIVTKGSISIDGISLTVASVEEESFQVSVIPHTAGETTLLDKKPGAAVNLENDVIGKYVQKLLMPGAKPKQQEDISLDFLALHGF